MAGAVKPPGLAFGTDDADEDDDPVDLVKGKIFCFRIERVSTRSSRSHKEGGTSSGEQESKSAMFSGKFGRSCCNSDCQQHQ